MFGFPLADFSRMFMKYSLRAGRGSPTSTRLYTRPRASSARNPFLQDALLPSAQSGQPHDQQGLARASCTTRSTTRSSRHAGGATRLSVDLAGLGGNTSFYKPRVEGVRMFQHTRRTSPRRSAAQVEYIAPCGSTLVLPIFERLVLGGEYSVRGYDIRSDRSARPGHRHRARRQQEPAVQRRVPDHDRRAGAPGALLRCRLQVPRTGHRATQNVATVDPGPSS